MFFCLEDPGTHENGASMQISRIPRMKAERIYPETNNSRIHISAFFFFFRVRKGQADGQLTGIVEASSGKLGALLSEKVMPADISN